MPREHAPHPRLFRRAVAPAPAAAGHQDLEYAPAPVRTQPLGFRKQGLPIRNGKRQPFTTGLQSPHMPIPKQEPAFGTGDGLKQPVPVGQPPVIDRNTSIGPAVHPDGSRHCWKISRGGRHEYTRMMGLEAILKSCPEIEIHRPHYLRPSKQKSVSIRVYPWLISLPLPSAVHRNGKRTIKSCGRSRFRWCRRTRRSWRSPRECPFPGPYWGHNPNRTGDRACPG